MQARLTGTFIDARLAQETRIAGSADTAKSIHLVDTRAAMTTGHASTFVDVHGTERAAEAGRTVAKKPVDHVDARAESARLARAFVHVRAAEGAAVACRANARESIELVHTRRATRARLARAFVDVRLTARAAETGRADAREPVQQIDTRRTARARLAGTFINVVRTGCAAISGRTCARKAVDVVSAHGSVLTRQTRAFVHVAAAQFSAVSAGTQTPKALSVRVIDAGAAVQTGLTHTLVCAGLAVQAVESGHARALVAAELVHTGSSVLARPAAAFVHVRLTSRTSGSCGTDARIEIYAVHTRSAVCTGRRRTLVNIH